jgi:hypothetical protein
LYIFLHKLWLLEKEIPENFNILENIIINVEVAILLWYEI